MRVIVNQNVAPKDEDIFVQGNLVISTDKQTIVLVTGESHCDGDFAGVCVHDVSYAFDDGSYSVNWTKRSFVWFEGNVILEQE